MKTIEKYFIYLIVAVTIISAPNLGLCQNMSFSKAYSALNGGSGSSGSGNSSASTIGVGIVNGYTNKNNIYYGIPENMVGEYYSLKNGLIYALVIHPNSTNNSTNNAQQAFNDIIGSHFVKISEYAPVNVKLNFRFSPPQIAIYGTDPGQASHYLYTSISTPDDAGIFQMPGTPVSGSKIMIIKK